MIYLELFWSFFQIGLFSIGGGYAAMPLIQRQIVEVHRWLTLTQFSDIITISQMTPGPIAINAATFTGIRVAGIPGALAATCGCVLPSCIIVLCLAWMYYRYRSLSLMRGVLAGLRPAVVAMVAGSGFTLLSSVLWPGGVLSLSATDKTGAALFAAGLLILRKWKLNPVAVMIGAGAAGFICYYFFPAGGTR